MSFIKKTREKKNGIKIIYSVTLFAVFFLAYNLLWPAFWNLVILPKTSPDSHGLRIELFKKGLLFNSTAGKMESVDSYVTLDRPEHSALAFVVWEVPVSGRYRLLLETDSTCDLNLDGKTVLKIQGFYPQNGDGIIQYLKQGPHLLLFKFYSGPNKGWVDFKVQQPGEATFSRLSQPHLRYIKLNNFPEWWNFIHFLKWGLILGLCLILLFQWRPELSKLLGSKFLFVWLANRNALIWVFFGLLMFILVMGSWPFLWKYFLLPKATAKGTGMQVEFFAGKAVAGIPVKVSTEPSSKLTLEDPQSSLRAYAVWNVTQAGQYALTLSCDGYGSLTIDEQLVVSFPERAIGQTETVPLYLTQGPHLLGLRLTNFANRGTVNLTVAGPGSPGALPLSGQELHSLPIHDVDLILRLIRTGKYIGLMGLSLALILLIIRLGKLGDAPINLYGTGPYLLLWGRGFFGTGCIPYPPNIFFSGNAISGCQR